MTEFVAVGHYFLATLGDRVLLVPGRRDALGGFGMTITRGIARVIAGHSTVCITELYCGLSMAYSHWGWQLF